MMPDTPANSTTDKSILVDGPTIFDTLETSNDHDWVRIELTAGQQILIAVEGITLPDSYVTVRDATGNALSVNDDSGPGLDARLVFTASATGTYYIDVSSYRDSFAGSYQLGVTSYVAPPVADLATIATHLAHGYWDGDDHHFAVTQGGSISVNLTALPGDAQALARQALQLWSDIIGVAFTEVATGGQITFDDNEEGAFSERTGSGGSTVSSHVNVSSQWLIDYGNTVGTYAFQTYIHEIGHALGLGHGGFYNGDGSYAGDAIFANDGWPTTVMSYFDQDENSYFANLDFMSANVLTPMLADIRAMAMLYGLSTTTRVGDTVYGIGNNSGRDVFTVTPNGPRPQPQTIVDSGGIDTLNYSSYGGQQIIDLNSESFSNISGGVGNVVIGYGTIIENAIGGVGDDVIIGNGANNVLSGGNDLSGDTVSYATASAGVTVSLGITGPQNTIGAGIDTLSGFEDIWGSPFDDRLTGGPAFGEVRSGAGNDILIAGASGNFLFGDVGDDTFFNGAGSDTINGGPGFDTVDYSNMTAGVNSQSGMGGADGIDWLNGIERQIGSNFDDILVGMGVADSNVLIGGGGNDILRASYAGDILTGGPGDDIFSMEPAGLNGDTITDFSVGDRILFSYTRLADFSFSLSGSTLSFTGGTLMLTGFTGTLVASYLAASATHEEGVQLTIGSIGPADVRNDFNGDGRSDILWRNIDGQLSDWLGTANGGFVQNNANAAAVVPTSWQIAGTGDFNGDGRDDILWRNVDGQLSNWLATASGGFVQNNANAAAVVPTAWSVAGTGDFNGDGRDDILWRNTNGTVSDWLGQSNGGFVANDVNAARFVPTSWSVVGTGDFNGDGRDDILWRNSNGQLSDWLGQANGGFVLNDAIALTQVDTAWSVVGTGDFNGDGRDDILWRNTNGTISTWSSQANGGFVNNGAISGVFVPLAWTVAAVGDYNGDGRDDILWRNADGTVTDWLANPNGSFTPNDAAAAQSVPTAWHVQPEAPFI